MRKTSKVKKSKPTGKKLVREIVDAHLTGAKGGYAWPCFFHPKPSPTPSCGTSGPCSSTS